jgi:hypothetical protein
VNPLVGSSLIKVNRIRPQHPGELLLVQNQQVIEAFPSHAPQKAFAIRISSWRLDRCARAS